MPENLEPPPPTVPALPAPKRRRAMAEKHFLQTLIVRRSNGEKLAVPWDALANRNAIKILATKVRDVVENELDKAIKEDDRLPPQEVKNLADAAKNAAELSLKAYEGMEPSLIPPGSGASESAMAAYHVAKGVAAGMSQTMGEWFSKLDELGRRGERKEKNITPDKSGTPAAADKSATPK